MDVTSFSGTGNLTRTFNMKNWFIFVVTYLDSFCVKLGTFVQHKSNFNQPSYIA